MYKVKDSGGYYRIWNNDVNSNAYIIMKDSSIGRIINNYISDGMISEDNLTRMCRIGGKSVKKLSSKDLEKVNSGIDKMVSANKKVKKNPKKKCNRKKSLKIRKGFVKAGFYLSTIILLTGGVKHFSGKKSDSTGEKYSTEKSIDDDYEHSSGDYIYSDYNIDDTVEEEKDSTPIDEEKDKETIIRNYEDENDDVMDFYYDDYDVSEESAKNVMQYIDLCKKYCDMYGEDIFTIHNFDNVVGLCIGNEGHGVSETIRKEISKKISIPMKNNVESLNAGVSASVIMYHISINQKEIS